MRKHNFILYALPWICVVAWSFHQQLNEYKNDARELADRETTLFLESFINLGRLYHERQTPIQQTSGLLQVDMAASGDGQNPPPDVSQPLAAGAYCSFRDMIGTLPESRGMRFHITSLTPLRAENSPDEWEQAALSAFVRGETVPGEISNIDGQPFYRNMKPLPADSGCLGCHVRHDSQPVLTHGGVSASIPGETIDKFVSDRLPRLALTYLLIGCAGLAIGFSINLSTRKIQRRLEKAKRHLQLAYLDVLTQLPNRRYYDFFVNREWKRAKRQAYPLSMIMIDIDYFKVYNDRYGHVQGDQCLKQVAKTLRKFFRRAGDLIARYGGEEFCVVAACDSEQIAQLAEILRKAVEDIKIPHSGSKISDYVTISLGAATVLPTEHTDFEVLLRQADQTLYRAKENGRNRVETYIGACYLQKFA